MAVDILSETKCKNLEDGKHSDGRGLYLFVRGASRTWSLRYTDPSGRRREMSLGVYPDVSLKAARAKRDEARTGLAEGYDPQAVRQAVEDRTVATITAKCFDAIKGDLKGNGEAGRWLSPVNTHILPKLGGMDITKLTATQVRDALSPVWRSKTSASEKALQRLGIVMRHAAAAFPGEMDLQVVQNARILLGSQGHKVTNIPAMPWADLPAFYAKLGETPTELAMRLLILTASRSRPVRMARVEQFEDGVWNIPAENMKNSQSFRVPMSEEARRVVEAAVPLARDGFLFCAYRGKPISDAAMAKFLDRAGLEYRPHGFRSSFRDWAEEHGEDWTLAEVSLAHSVGTKTQRSYQRSDLLEQRRLLMDRWAEWVTHTSRNG
ncbi:tyrosine-type recombinase/integrase [Aliiruegeria lutimaris]|uniref:Phage integrase family protein n=1 Tax=Aliiruegeria lutimaris TaxID=571298 RepID=A0A1G9L7K9_9RHOB|nr:site-specific integrase [Aliiruegeria lutimaris]SDL57733.1 Phage integrase family protein [Aliiruegeria lutimaris]